MQRCVYFVGWWILKAIQALPLEFVARAGRTVGYIVYWLDARHRRVARGNITAAFPEFSPQRVEALVRENFRRIGESFGCAVKTTGMSYEQLKARVAFDIATVTSGMGERSRRWVVAIGHFGNFELYSAWGHHAQLPTATTYRGLKQKALDDLLKSLRVRSGCLYFERRSESGALREFMGRPEVLLGLLSDQHAGDGGIPLPFLGRPCSTSAAPALFALRYDCRLTTGFCYRTGLARWRMETGPEIATHEAGKPRPLAEIMLDVNRALEAAVRRDPANWFWVHNRWKKKWRKPRAGTVAAANSAGATEQGKLAHG